MTWRAACPNGFAGSITYRCNNGRTQQTARSCSRTAAPGRGHPPLQTNMCTSGPMTYRGLTSTAAYNARCVHRCIAYGQRSWCTVAMPHRVHGGHAHRGWGWCYRCGQVPRQMRCRYARNAAVSANWRGRGRWYNARVTAAPVREMQANNRGTICLYNLAYSDGDKEPRVPENRIKARVCRGSFSVCDRVQVNWRNRGRWFAGRVQAKAGAGCNQLYSIRYDDGDREVRVPGDRIRVLRGAAGGQFRIRQNIEANYRGRGRWYPGTIARVVSACCYQVTYLDGDREACVDPRNIRARANRPCQDSARRRCLAGYTAQANWKGYGRYYAARVISCSGGMFTLRYNDGDRESNVPGSRLRGCNQCPAQAYERNARVYANYRGQGYWYPGRIQGAARVGGAIRYTVRYADGDTEQRLTTCLIRPFGARAAACGTFKIGTRARVKHSNGRCYPAWVCGGCTNGRYNICFDDGDRARNVPAAKIFTGRRINTCR